MFEIEEDKLASKSSDTSDTANVTFYAIGVIAAVSVAEMIIRNRMHKSNWIVTSVPISANVKGNIYCLHLWLALSNT